MSGNVQTRIRPITGRHSLLPTSQARTAIGVPCGTLSQPGGRERYGVSTFHSEKYAGLGACYRPGGYGPRGRSKRTSLPPPVPFGSSVSASFACSHLRSLSQIQIPSPYQLSSTHPAVVARRARLSRFVPRTRCASFHCLGSSLFMPVDSPGGTGGSLRFQGNNFSKRLRVALLHCNSSDLDRGGHAVFCACISDREY